MRVAVLGHSQTKYLNFRFSEHEIIKFYKSGATFTSIRQSEQFQRLIHYKPDIIFLLLGSNDLTENSDINQIIESYIKLKEEILEKINPTQGTYLLDLERRTKNNRFVNCNKYRKIRNSFIKKVKKIDKPNFLPYRPVSGLLESNIGPDGVHINAEGARKIKETIEIKIREILSV